MVWWLEQLVNVNIGPFLVLESQEIHFNGMLWCLLLRPMFDHLLEGLVEERQNSI